ncbi:MAG TPA: hypothetical protein VHZ97_03355 [Pseudonocardiaceae bacterium]|jgi:hypothetical protein|nr:hypothetical protein [Pseudonocardiaceae bacterium]
MSWRLILAIVIGAAVLVAALIIVYATPFGDPPTPAHTASPAHTAELLPYPGIIRRVDDPRGTVTVTEADDHNIVWLTVGDTIHVDLPPDWLPPTTKSGVVRANGRTFTAIATGNGTIDSVRLDAGALWQLSVDVTPG